MSEFKASSLLLIVTFGLAAITSNGCGQQQRKAPSPPASLEINPTERNQLKTLDYVPVAGAKGPGGQAFFVARRTNKIGQYPCQSCHETPLPPTPTSEVSSRWMHTDIQLDHAATMTCQTCHNYDQMHTLKFADGLAPLSFDHSYNQCGQCHFQQLRDWRGGAHGKRLGGWQGKRIVQNCSACHNPHAPAFTQRIPIGFPRVPRTSKGH